MASSARITTMWTTRDAAQVAVTGRGGDAAVDRLERAFPEVFGEVPHPRDHTGQTSQPDPAHQLSSRNAG